MEAVGKLDQQDADVGRHGQQHLADILGLKVETGIEFHLVDLGDAGDDGLHIRAEFGPQILVRHRTVRFLEDAVQQTGLQRFHIELHGGQGMGHGQRMVDVRRPVRPFPLPMDFER